MKTVTNKKHIESTASENMKHNMKYCDSNKFIVKTVMKTIENKKHIQNTALEDMKHNMIKIESNKMKYIVNKQKNRNSELEKPFRPLKIMMSIQLIITKKLEK